MVNSQFSSVASQKTKLKKKSMNKMPRNNNIENAVLEVRGDNVNKISVQSKISQLFYGVFSLYYYK